MELTFNLTRPAKSRGGDRYEATVEGEFKPLVVYFPQSMTRNGGDICPGFKVTVEPAE